MKFLLLLALVTGLSAQDYKVRAYVSQNNVTTETTFQYTVEIEGSSTSSPDVDYPDFNDFFVLGGPNSSTSIQYVNGKMSSKRSFSYYLKARSEGEFTIGPARVQIGGDLVETEPVTVKVSAGATRSQQAQQPQQTTDPEIAGESLFLKTEISKRRPYVGEEVVVTYKLYFKLNVRSYEFDKMPANTGFWTEMFDMPKRPAVDTEIVNGVNYSVATLRKVALFPTRSGEIRIDPLVVNLDVHIPDQRDTRRSLFDSFFDVPRGRNVRKQIESKPITLNVKQLPQENRPADFSGAVGRFDFDVDVDNPQNKVNEAITLRMNLTGTGNIKLAELPVLNLPPDIEQYDPKINTRVDNGGEHISGSKSAEYLLIPRVPGEYQIDGLDFVYFDPQREQYVREAVPGIVLNITGDASREAGGPAAVARREVELLGTDVRFIKESGDLRPIGRDESLGWPFWLSMTLALVAFGAFLVYDEHRARIAADSTLARSRYASRVASRFLAEAASLEKNGAQADFYKAVSSALQRFVLDKLNIDLSDFSAQTARQKLQQKNIPAELIDEYISVLSACDMRQFAGIGEDGAERHDVLEQARKLITQMDKKI